MAHSICLSIISLALTSLFSILFLCCLDKIHTILLFLLHILAYKHILLSIALEVYFCSKKCYSSYSPIPLLVWIEREDGSRKPMWGWGTPSLALPNLARHIHTFHGELSKGSLCLRPQKLFWTTAEDGAVLFSPIWFLKPWILCWIPYLLCQVKQFLSSKLLNDILYAFLIAMLDKTF